MNWSLNIEPFFPIYLTTILIGLLALVACIGIIFAMRARFFRAAACLFLAIALLNPALRHEQRDPLTSIVAIVVDNSPSQRLGNRQAQSEQALAQLQEKLARLPQFELRVGYTNLEQGADQQNETKLFDALSKLISDVSPARFAGAIVISDGQVHDIPRKQSGLGFDAPLHALITGESDEFDRRIAFIQAPRFAIANKALDMTYKVTSSDGDRTPIAVKIIVNGEEQGTDFAQPDIEMPLQIIVPNAGRSIVELFIEPVPGELTDINNTTINVIEAVRENLRVLLVSGAPHSGERAWRDLLKSDASVDLIHFTILRPPEKQDNTPNEELSLIAFPTHELFVEKIDDFDLIILDRYQNRNVLPILYYDYIAQYVLNGGALLIAAGPEFANRFTIAATPLISALPAIPTGKIIEKGFFPRLTETGKRHPVTRSLTGATQEPPQWGRWFRQIDVTDAKGDVVLKGVDDKPLLILNRIGHGRVAMLLSDQGWLWARGFEGGGPHVALYRRIAHWLMGEPELEEERLTASSKAMEITIERQSMNEKVASAQVTSPSGIKTDLELNADGTANFSATMSADEIGLYKVSNGDLSTLVHVGAVNAPEFSNALSTTKLLAPIIEANSGTIRTLSDNANQIPSLIPIRQGTSSGERDWIGLRKSDQSILRSVDHISLFSGFLGMALGLLIFGAMWYREGR